MDKLKWCFNLKNGLRMIESNERLSKSYLERAKSSLERAEKNFRDDDLLWTTVVIYYAEYYALYSFLQKIGVKCENHSCSISAVTYLLGREKTKIIDNHKGKRIDAQYYMEVGKEKKIREMLRQCKKFVSEFDNIISGLGNEDIKKYRENLSKFQ